MTKFICKILSPKRKKHIDPLRKTYFKEVEQCLRCIENGLDKNTLLDALSYLYAAEACHTQIKYLTKGNKEKYELWNDYFYYLVNTKNTEDIKKKAKKSRKTIVKKAMKKNIYYRQDYLK